MIFFSFFSISRPWKKTRNYNIKTFEVSINFFFFQVTRRPLFSLWRFSYAPTRFFIPKNKKNGFACMNEKIKLQSVRRRAEELITLIPRISLLSGAHCLLGNCDLSLWYGYLYFFVFYGLWSEEVCVWIWRWVFDKRLFMPCYMRKSLAGFKTSWENYYRQ